MRRRFHHIFWTFGLVVCLGMAVSQADDVINFSDERIEFFEREVRPLLAKRCYSCHSEKAKEVKGELRLDSRALIVAGGETGAAIVPGDPKKSLLIDAINYGDIYQMPPKSKLPATEIATLTKWVEMKAPWPTETVTSVDPKKEFNLEQRKASHWCWQPPKLEELPPVKNKSWPTRSLDHFILSKLEDKGLVPATPADRRTLIRRAYFDVIGMPPSPKQVEAFVNDKSSNAFEKVVDQLLASEHFGERWARHWMDLVRYAESYGHEFDYPIPHAFQYRDYLIRAFNVDVPYNQFVTEHVAGDLMQSPRLHATEGYNESILGTGFWWLGEATHAPVDVLGDEAGRVDNQIDVMSRTFLALTVACARCHDHKFDAISTKDYYALSGFLKSSRRQEAFLDPKGRIGEATAKLKEIQSRGSKLIAASVQPGDLDSKYLLAAREVLFGKRKPKELKTATEDIVFEDFEDVSYGEWKATGNAFGKGPITQEDVNGYLPNVGVVGKRFVQTHHRIDGQNSGQTDQKTGTLTSPEFIIERRFINFKIGGGAHKGQTCLNLMIDGKVVRTETGRSSGTLFARQFEVSDLVGKTAKIQIVDNHRGGWGNVGVDQIVFTDQADNTKPGRSIQLVAEEFDLDSKVLAKWVAALQSDEVSQPSHPLNPWLSLAKSSGELQPQQIADARNRLNSQEESDKSRDEQFPLIADFNGETFDGWLPSGYAFGDRPTQLGDWNATSGSPNLTTPGIVHSGLYAGRQQGVLRSPTFTITHPNLVYRVAAKNAQIRLIIDNYFMDTYNGLLFRGFAMKVDTDGNWQWKSQSGDIGRYIGHRAHIEIIDHSNSWIAVDEIRFAKGGVPDEKANPLAQKILSQSGIDSHRNLADAYGAAILQSVEDFRQGKKSTESLALARWAINHDLCKMDESGSKDLEQLSNEFASITNSMAGVIRVLGMADGNGLNRHIHIRGNHKVLGEEAPRALLTAISGDDQKPIASGSGRLELARRMTDPNNALTSRVIVNRIWHHLFGRGIVASTDNFGVLGQRPTHQELLDHLAVRFTSPETKDGFNWSIKRTIKELMLSRTYQMASTPNEKGSELDPENLLLHRARIRRLQGEAIRDAILTISGRLDPRLYGGSVRVHVTPFMQGRGRPGSGPLDGAGRRSLYTEVRRNFLPPMMLAFDTPQPFNGVGRRNVSNVPAQALILMNDPFVIEQSKVFAKRLLSKPDSKFADRVEEIYLRMFSRKPDENELTQAREFITLQAQEYGVSADRIASDERAWADLCHVLMNVKEFIYLN